MFELVIFVVVGVFLWNLDEYLIKKENKEIIRKMKEKGINEDAIFIAETWMK
ncbi:MAG: hypothetical protein FWB90_02830 [Fibromonadales bacterium]|nr:hypothetical protein [Fibromonadales bacterium]